MQYPTHHPDSTSCRTNYRREPTPASPNGSLGTPGNLHAIVALIASRSIECGDCVLWQGGCSNGHPSARVDGKWQLLRRVLHEANHGPIPPGKLLRVTCENKRCLNPEHWKVSTFRAVAIECSRMGLMSDRVRSGKIAAAKRASSQARITQDDARAIRASNDSGAALARRYGIAESTVSKIRRGEVRREFAGNVWAGLA